MEAVSVWALLFRAEGRRGPGFGRHVRERIRALQGEGRAQGRREGARLRQRDCLSAARQLPARRPRREARGRGRAHAALSRAQGEAGGGRALRPLAQASAAVHAAPHRNRDERGGRRHPRHVHGPHPAVPRSRDTALPEPRPGRGRAGVDRRRHRVLRFVVLACGPADCRARGRVVRGSFLLQRRDARARGRIFAHPDDQRRRPRDRLHALRFRGRPAGGNALHRGGDRRAGAVRADAEPRRVALPADVVVAQPRRLLRAACRSSRRGSRRGPRAGARQRPQPAGPARASARARAEAPPTGGAHATRQGGGAA